MSEKPPKKRGDIYKIPARDLAKYRDSWQDRASPFKNFARVNLDELQFVHERLEKPERRVLLSMMRRMHARNMVILSREQLQAWLISDYQWCPDQKHISTYVHSLEDKSAIKTLCRVTVQSDDEKRRDIITYCINPMLIFKGKDKQHRELILQWDYNEIVPPPVRKQRTQQTKN